MFGWLMLLLMAVSMMAIFSRRSLPGMAAGSIIVFTATRVPFHIAAGSRQDGAKAQKGGLQTQIMKCS
jgi:hypothetical protein